MGQGTLDDTFLKVLTGELEPSKGDVFVTPGERISILKQDHNAYDALGEDLFVADCMIDSACSGVRLGCPSDNTIRGALFTNCVFRGRIAVQSGHPVRYIRPGTGFPKGNCLMEDILFVDCTVDVRGSPVRFYAEEGVCLRKFGNVTFRRMRLRGGAAIELTGNADSVVENVRFEEVSGEIADKTPVVMQYVRGVAFDGFAVSCVREGAADGRRAQQQMKGER